MNKVNRIKLMEEEIRAVEVFAGTAWEAGLVKSLLENAEVQAFLLDEIRGTLAPWHIAPGGAGAVKVVVSSVDYEKAVQVVADFEDNQNQNSVLDEEL
ncbi:MAG: DUF2007 domain-containing protein [Lentimicrobiaceae bacterium]|nr:DUF2007 domain-containing protein [Lentimicrobiaceae bacterium]